MKLAYSVCETEENTGGIFFAHHRIAATIRGANEYADGEITQVSCRRAPWADQFADTGRVPAWAMVASGWHFECFGCGVRIDSDLRGRWYENARADDTLSDLKRDARRYRKWDPTHVVGFGEGPGRVFCDATCETEHAAAEARKSQVEDRLRATYRRLVAKRFPGAEIEGKGHVCVTELDGGRWRVEQIIIRFDYPGRRYALGELRVERDYSGRRGGRRINATCSSGDLDAFNAWRNVNLKKAA